MTKQVYTTVCLSPMTGNWEWSRAFDKKVTAMKWAKKWSQKWPMRVYQGRPGEMFLAEFRPAE